MRILIFLFFSQTNEARKFCISDTVHDIFYCFGGVVDCSDQNKENLILSENGWRYKQMERINSQKDCHRPIEDSICVSVCVHASMKQDRHECLMTIIFCINTASWIRLGVSQPNKTRCAQTSNYSNKIVWTIKWFDIHINTSIYRTVYKVQNTKSNPYNKLASYSGLRHSEVQPFNTIRDNQVTIYVQCNSKWCALKNHLPVRVTIPVHSHWIRLRVAPR